VKLHILADALPDPQKGKDAAKYIAKLGTAANVVYSLLTVSDNRRVVAEKYTYVKRCRINKAVQIKLFCALLAYTLASEKTVAGIPFWKVEDDIRQFDEFRRTIDVLKKKISPSN